VLPNCASCGSVIPSFGEGGARPVDYYPFARRAKANAGFSYGYQWWIYEGLPWDAYRAYGDHHVFLILVPGLDLEIVIEGQVKDDIGILKRYLLPALGPAQGG